jgi:hypothetical protein
MPPVLINTVKGVFMRTGSSFFEVLLCTGLSVSLALAALHYVSPAKEVIISGFKKYVSVVERVQDAEDVSQVPGGIDLLRKMYESVDGSVLSVELSSEELELLKFLSEG